MFSQVDIKSDMALKNESKETEENYDNVSNDIPDLTPMLKRSGTDPGWFLSPPTVARYTEKTDSPRPYFLRTHTRWSSTPLPSLTQVAGNTDKQVTSVPSFDQRLLDNLDETTACSSFTCRVAERDSDKSSINNKSERDSGYDSLIDKTHQDSTHDTIPQDSTPDKKDTTNDTSLLGAVPKRRSPRQLSARQTDGLQRVARGGQDHISSLRGGHDNIFSLSDKFSSKLCRGKTVLHTSKEGKELCDIVRFLFERNLTHVLGQIYKYLPGQDLCLLPQVSQLWGISLASCKWANEERLSFVAIKRLDRENFGKKLSLRSSALVSSPRKVMAEVVNCSNSSLVSPGGTKRDLASRGGGASFCQVSPSKIRHRLFVSEAAKLSPGERLVHCPLCTSPSRVTTTLCTSPSKVSLGGAPDSQRATCSSPKCNFVFCPLCQCGDHEGRGCRVTRTTSSKLPKSGTVTSKKSKARLRRL